MHGATIKKRGEFLLYMVNGNNEGKIIMLKYMETKRREEYGHSAARDEESLRGR